MAHSISNYLDATLCVYIVKQRSVVCNCRNCPAISGEVWWWYWFDCVCRHRQWSGNTWILFKFLFVVGFLGFIFCSSSSL